MARVREVRRGVQSVIDGYAVTRRQPSNTICTAMEKKSTNRSFAVWPLALLAIVVPAVSAQHSGSSPNQTTSGSPYVESKFELATTDPSRDTAFYSKLGFSVVAKTSYGYVTLRSGPVVIALSPVARINSDDTASLS